MTSPPPNAASREPPNWRLHRSGPWLVTYGSGPDSEDVAVQVREQCVARGVATVVCPIDEIQQVRSDHFTGLIVVLPSQPADPSVALRPFARLIGDYRARRPEGLESIINGSCEWFDAGVVQVVGQPTIIQHPAMRIALGRVCAQHNITVTGLLDVFQPYTTQHFVPVQQLEERPTASEVRDENIERLWRYVQTWGVADVQDVPKLRKCIDGCRQYYENKNFSQLHRPISNILRNRLDIILDGPHGEVTGNRKAWMENGARVCRYVVKELQKIVPALARPGGNTKDAQKQLRRFYRDLRIIERHMYDFRK